MSPRALALAVVVGAGCGPLDEALSPVEPRLLVNEVGTSPPWIELVNCSNQPANLGEYALRTAARDRQTGLSVGSTQAATSFALPSVVVAPGAFVLVEGQTRDDLEDGPGRIFVRSGDRVPGWPNHGAVELVRAAHGRLETVDYVPFGAAGAPPAETSAWSGPPIPALDPALPASSIARAEEPRDTNTAADFVPISLGTPGGPNDVTDATDGDEDGIPDEAEGPGGTFAGVPLGDLGARPGQRDLFVEIDWMDPTGYDGTPDPGLLPQAQALLSAARALAEVGVVLHVDAGSAGGGGQIPFVCRTAFSPATETDTAPDAVPFARLRARHFDVARTASFHYVVFAHSQDDVPCGDDGSTGAADTPGSAGLVTLGRYGLGGPSEVGQNLLVNVQASVLLHELGHNLGLLHGGDEARNDKPPYLSVMNYLYTLTGLPASPADEGDRYYFAHALACGPHGAVDLGDLSAPPTGPPSAFRLAFSDGSSMPLVEARLDERAGFGRPGSAGIDFDWDGVVEASAAADLDGSSGEGGCVAAGAATDTLRDHDDGAALVLAFRATPAASAAASPPREPRAPAPLRERLRRAR